MDRCDGTFKTKTEADASYRRSVPGRLTADAVRRLSVILLSALLPCSGFATQREATSTITRLYAYTQFGGGDIIVQLAVAVPGCAKGFWLSPNDNGFKTTYALLLSAYHTQTPLRIAGDDTQIWTGSGDVYCRMTFAGVDS